MILIVSRTARHFDLGYVSVLSPIGRPLDHGPRLDDAGDNPMHQLKFGDLEMFHPFTALANTCTNIKDFLLVFVE